MTESKPRCSTSSTRAGRPASPRIRARWSATRSPSPFFAALALALAPASIAPPCDAQPADDTAELVERLAKQECERLMNAVVPIAESHLLKTGEFPPYAAALTPEGRVVNVGDWGGGGGLPEEETVKKLHQGLVAAARSGAYVATAMVLGVRITLPDSGEESDAVVVSLDHRDDYSMVVVLPYRLENGAVTFGDPIARKGEGGIFGSPDGG